MTIPQYARNALLKSAGFGVLDFSRYPDSTRSTLFEDPLQWMQIQIDKIRAQLSKAMASQPVFVAINSDPGVNAIAIPKPTYSLVSLNAGLCVRLRQLFQFAVADREFFPAVASERSVGDDLSLRFGLVPSILLERVNLALSPTASDDDYVHLYGPLPSTRERFELAHRLTTAAVDFVAMHEFAHIVRRHSVFLSQGQRIHFREVPDRASSIAQGDIHQLLEVDADLKAAEICAVKFTSANNIKMAWGGWARTDHEALSYWLFAVLMTFQLLERWTPADNIEHFTHPEPAARLLTMMAGVCERIDGIAPDDFMRLLGTVIKSARLLWARLGLPLDGIARFREMDQVGDLSTRLIGRYNSDFLPRFGHEQSRRRNKGRHRY